MTFKKLSTFILLIIFVLQADVFGQTTAVRKDDVVPDVSKNAAVSALTTLAREASQLAVPENRISAQIQVGALLWPHNEREARLILDAVNAELRNMLAASNVPPGVELKTSERSRFFNQRQILAELRSEYVLALAAFDAKASIDALNGLRVPVIEEYDPLRADDLELKITAAIVRNDPDESYAVAKRQFETNGLNYQFVDALKNLHKKDSKLSAALGRDILEKVSTAKIRVPSANGSTNVKKLAGEIDFWELSSFVVAASQMNRAANADKSKKMLPIFGDAEMKELIGVLATAFLNENDPALYAISQSLPEITRHAPVLAQRIRKKLGPGSATQLDKITETNDFYYQSENKSPDELARLADVSAADVRDSRYAFAATKALENNDAEKAQTIAARIKDRKSYAYLLEQVDAALPLSKARRGDLEEVRRMLFALKTDQERIAALTELASALAAKGDKEGAKALLGESRQMMSVFLRRFSDLDSVVKVAGVYAVTDTDEAFTLVETGIGQMTDYINAGIKLSDFYEREASEIAELPFSAISRQMLIHVPKASELMRNLAAADFERTMRLAESFQQPEIRLFVRLRIVEAVLDKEAPEKERLRLDQVSGDDETE